MLQRHWLPPRSQWNLGHLMSAVAACAAALGLARLSGSALMLLALGACLVFGPIFLARKGFSLVDIATVLAIVLLALCFLLPTMAQIRYRSAGQRIFPIPIPPSVAELFRSD
jgi:hypothetical protein